MGNLFIAWSIRLALLFFAAALLTRLWKSKGGLPSPKVFDNRDAGLWTTGFLLFVVHVFTAYH